jgi:purine-nucleoside phosphorylase
MGQTYSEKLVACALQCAQECGITLHTGVYTGVSGPSLETPAETRFLRSCGADAVGMSTIPEVIAAKHLDMEVLGISLIANVNDPDNFMPITLATVIKQAHQSQQQLQVLLSALLPKILAVSDLQMQKRGPAETEHTL